MSSERFEKLGGYGRISREIEAHIEADAVERWTKKRPANARGATPPFDGLSSAAALGATQPAHTTSSEYNPDHHRSLIGEPETSYDRLQREVGSAKLDNEVVRDLLEVAWTTITTLAPTGQNNAADALRARIWAHLHDEEAECPTCDHYIVNHEAAGPCACEGCECQSNGPPTEDDGNILIAGVLYDAETLEEAENP